jgi:outer membrane protein TolC
MTRTRTGANSRCFTSRSQGLFRSATQRPVQVVTNLRKVRENIASQTNALQLTQDRFRAGLSSELDVEQATALLATTQSQVPVLEKGFSVTAHRLAVLLGQPPATLIHELSRPVGPASAAVRVPVGLPSELLRRRPDIQQAERQLAAATARIGAAKASCSRDSP